MNIDANAHVKTIWRDEDPFPSLIKNIVQTKQGLELVVRRERPVGIRNSKTLDDTRTKRWADLNNSISEFSIIQLDGTGRPTHKYDSTFGIGAFVQGLLTLGNRPLMYGTLAGYPAISVRAH